jgi:hypothetical protein
MTCHSGISFQLCHGRKAAVCNTYEETKIKNISFQKSSRDVSFMFCRARGCAVPCSTLFPGRYCLLGPPVFGVSTC